jgi:hypothetical protein
MQILRVLVLHLRLDLLYPVVEERVETNHINIVVDFLV